MLKRKWTMSAVVLAMTMGLAGTMPVCADEGTAALSGEMAGAYADVLEDWKGVFDSMLDGADVLDRSDVFTFRLPMDYAANWNRDSLEVRFYLKDLDGNGTPELLTGKRMWDDFEGRSVYTTLDIFSWNEDLQAVEKITPQDEGFMYMLGDGTVFCDSGKGNSYYTFYRYNGNGPMKAYDGYEYSFGNGEEQRNWKHQTDPENITVTEPSSSEEFLNAVSSRGMMVMETYPYTEENLAALRSGDLGGLAGAESIEEVFVLQVEE